MESNCAPAPWPRGPVAPWPRCPVLYIISTLRFRLGLLIPLHQSTPGPPDPSFPRCISACLPFGSFLRSLASPIRLLGPSPAGCGTHPPSVSSTSVKGVPAAQLRYNIWKSSETRVSVTISPTAFTSKSWKVYVLKQSPESVPSSPLLQVSVPPWKSDLVCV